jgi:hypothetical protein
MRASSAAALLVLLACQSTEPSRFVGNFAAPLRDRSGYLAFQIYENDGHLSGRAWSSYSTTLLAGVTLNGTRIDSTIDLTIRPRLPQGLVNYRFVGTLAGDTLKGVFSLPGTDAQQVTMPRVGTIPLGDYVITVTGSPMDSSAGYSTFNYTGGSFRLLQFLFVPDRSVMVITWNRRDRPVPGRYPVTAEGGEAPSVRFDYAPASGAPEASYQIQGGVITIQESERYVMRGRFTMTAADPEGRVVTLTGVFNSGCTGNAC